MRRALFGLGCGLFVLAIAACVSLPHQGSGPVGSFSFLAATNPGLSRDVLGEIVDQAEPALILCVVPPGVNVKKLIASTAVNAKATVSVTAGGQRVVQSNGITVNDFSQPVLYSIETPGEKDPWLYRVIVREAETNARLAQINLPTGARLQPAFSPMTEQYTLEVPFTTTQVIVAAIAQSGNLSGMTIAETSYPGALAVGAVDFSAGQERTIQVKTLAEDGATSVKYTFTVKRAAAERNTTLAFVDVRGASVSSAPQNPTAFVFTVPYETHEVFVQARTQSSAAKAALLSPGEAASTAAPVSLGDPGAAGGTRAAFPSVTRMPLSIVVTAQDGTVQQYSLEILRAAPDSSKQLAELTIDVGALTPKFSSDQLAYVAEVPYSTKKLTIRARAQSKTASISLVIRQPGSPTAGSPATMQAYPEGAAVEFLTVDMLGATIDLTAQNGERIRYSLLIHRAAPDRDANLASLTASAGTLSPAFSIKQDSYTLRLPPDILTTQITATTTSPYATVVFSTPASASEGQDKTATISLGQGEKSQVRFLVIAEDGTPHSFQIQVETTAAVGGALGQSPALHPVLDTW